MPDKETLDRVREDRREGKSASTQAGEFIREEFHHIREGKHGARSTKQAIAIGLSKARRAGVGLKAPAKGTTSEAIRHRAEVDYEKGHGPAKNRKPSSKRSRAAKRALRKMGHSAASHAAIARQARSVAKKRTAAQRSASARKAARTRAANSR